jgi:formylglycine-generating enzyme
MRIPIALILLAFAIDYGHAQEPGSTFKDCDECPEMIAIAKGRYVMGIPRGEEERHQVPPPNFYRGEPMTEITLTKNFAMAKLVVTRGDFARFVKETGWTFPDNKGCWESYGKPLATTNNIRRDMGRPDIVASLNWLNPGFQQEDTHPVVCVAWIDIRAYLTWLSAKAGKTYRLPTEAEWEYVARAGTMTARPWGDEDAPACKHANVADMSRAKQYELDPSPYWIFQCDDGFPNTAPVGSFPPNKYGLYDMIGNVWQVLEDCFEYTLDTIPRDGSPRISDPTKRRDPSFRIVEPTVGPYDKCDMRVSRGGSFDIMPYSVRTGYRSRFEIWRPDSGAVRLAIEGFRVARTLD